MEKYSILKVITFVSIIYISISCQITTRVQPKDTEISGLIKTNCPKSIKNDIETETLLAAIEQSINYYNSLNDSANSSSNNNTFKYAENVYSIEEMLLSMYLFQRIISDKAWKIDNHNLISQYFDCYKMSVPDKKTLITGYYTPLIKGSLTKDSINSYPVYSKPTNLKVLNLGEFRNSLENRTIVYRLSSKNEIKPYFDRSEIKRGEIVNFSNPVAWVDDKIDLFFLHIQGSGILEIKGGKLYELKYDGANGRDYSSIGAYLVRNNKMKLEEVNLYSLKNYLRKNKNEVDEIFNTNKSYVFYSINEFNNNIVGSINHKLTALRSAAFDSILLPKGSLLFIDSKIPNCNIKGHCLNEDQEFNKFLLNQDTGGAIKGFDRADIYFGIGKKAEAISGNLKANGDIYFIVAKKELLN